MNHKVLKAVAVLVGTTIGAGIYGIPYVTAKVGFFVGVAYLLGLGILVMLLNLAYGELILRTPGDHQLTGYGEIYLGGVGKILATAGMFIGLYGALLAYLIKTGEFLALLTGFPSPFAFSLLFFVFGSGALLLGLRAVAFLDLVFVFFIEVLILAIAFFGLPHISINNYQLAISNLTISNLFLPYGVILFALSGFSAIPEMEEVLRLQHKKLGKAIAIGTIIPILTYILFATIVVGISGGATSDDAFSGLVGYLPGWIVRLGAGLGVLTMGTSFITLGYVLREIWHRDFRFASKSALALALLPPLALFLGSRQSFIAVLDYTGALTGGLTGVLLAIIFLRARAERGQKPPEYILPLPNIIIILLGIIFALGMLSPFITNRPTV